MFFASQNLLSANVALVIVILVFALLTLSCTQNRNSHIASSGSVTDHEPPETTITDQIVDDVPLRTRIETTSPTPRPASLSTGEELNEKVISLRVPREPVPGETITQNSPPESTPAAPRQDNDPTYRQARAEMIAKHLRGRDISDPRVLDAMARVPRHQFVPPSQRHLSYVDAPLPIGHNQTISQPYIVALMTQLVSPKPAAKALDIGTGSGYQAAVLAELVKTVYSIEIVKPLAEESRARLQSLGYKNIHVRNGDGYRGWPEEAPFDLIIVAAAPDHVPQPLVGQLAPGGKLVIPVGRFFQNLLIVEKAADGTVVQRNIAPVAFVPMTGEAQK